jgi:hypothetical protein
MTSYSSLNDVDREKLRRQFSDLRVVRANAIDEILKSLHKTQLFLNAGSIGVLLPLLLGSLNSRWLIAALVAFTLGIFFTIYVQYRTASLIRHIILRLDGLYSNVKDDKIEVERIDGELNNLRNTALPRVPDYLHKLSFALWIAGASCVLLFLLNVHLCAFQSIDRQ